MRPKQRIHSRWARIDDIRNIGVVIVLLFGLVQMFRDRIEDINDKINADAAGLEITVTAMGIALTVMVVLLVVIWFFTVTGEIQMLKDFAGDRIPQLPRAWQAVIMVAILLGLLLYFATNPLVFGCLMAVFLAYSLVNGRILNSRLHRGLAPVLRGSGSGTGSAGGEPPRIRRLRVIHDYYHDPWQWRLTAITLGVVLAAVGLATARIVVGETTSGLTMEIVSFSFLIGSILLNEVPRARWRHYRDLELGERYGLG